MTPTPRQRAILEWLNRAYPHAGRMFETALGIAADEGLPCRGRMIAHAYREICSILLNEYSSNSREDLDGKMRDFAAEYRKLNISFEAPASSVPTPEAGPVVVPESFLKAADAVVRTHSATANARARSRAVFEGLSRRGGPQADVGPTSDRWFEMLKYFPKRAHDRKTPDAEMMQGRFLEETEFFEETLAMFAASAVSNLDALDEILQDANT